MNSAVRVTLLLLAAAGLLRLLTLDRILRGNDLALVASASRRKILVLIENNTLIRLGLRGVRLDYLLTHCTWVKPLMLVISFLRAAGVTAVSLATGAHHRSEVDRTLVHIIHRITLSSVHYVAVLVVVIALVVGNYAAYATDSLAWARHLCHLNWAVNASSTLAVDASSFSTDEG